MRIKYRVQTSGELALLEPTTEVEIEFDATIREIHTSAAEVTKHPVEWGSSVADHVIPQAKRITVEAVVTNQPMKLPSTHMDGVTTRQDKGVLKFTGSFNRVKSVYDALTDIVENARLCTLTQGLRDYEDMILSNLTTPREGRDGDSIRVTFDAQQLRFVEVKTGPASGSKRSQRKRRGNKGTKEAQPGTKEEQALRSTLHRVVN